MPPRRRSPRPASTALFAGRAGVLICAAALFGCGAGASDATEPDGSTGAADAGRPDSGLAATDAGADAAPADATSCSLSGYREYLDIPYLTADGVAPDLLSFDLYEPLRSDGCPAAPLVVWVHGGGWSIGDKRNQIADKVELFMAEGWVFASVNYRLSPAVATDDPDAVRYPIHNEDVTAAIAWLRDHAADWRADPERVFVFGHSAGAGIVSQIVTNERFLAAHALGLDAIRCAAMLDTEAYDVRAQCEEGSAIYLNAFGTDPAVWDEASAMSHVEAGKGIPASLVVTRGMAARRALSAQFVDMLAAVGVSAALVDANPLSHAEVNDAVGAPGDTIVTPPLMDFLRGCAED